MPLSKQIGMITELKQLSKSFGTNNPVVFSKNESNSFLTSYKSVGIPESRYF